ncbi:MAG TPA: hypothetical protein VM912_08005, partial [Terriglobales bacterium]|nr:hypothetical protein [Terriglobales bacterium]
NLLGVFLSGSGPSIVALARERCAEIEALMSQRYRKLGIPFQTSILQAHTPAFAHASAVVSCR